MGSLDPVMVNRLTPVLTDEGCHVTLSSSLHDIDISRTRSQTIDGRLLMTGSFLHGLPRNQMYKKPVQFIECRPGRGLSAAAAERSGGGGGMSGSMAAQTASQTSRSKARRCAVLSPVVVM